MGLSTYHLHTTFSDGKNTAEEMIKQAIASGCAEIGFSDHSPFDFDCSWDIKNEKIAEYVSTLKMLKEKYKDKIKVYVGIEQDYYSAYPDWHPDYIIGSVHYILKDGEYLPIDEGAETMKQCIDKFYEGDVYAYCEDYYALVADVYNKTKCDIIGHFDLVTKFNEKMPIIDTSHPRYIKAVDKALSALALTPAIFELNTGAISRGYRTSPYPSDEIIDKIAKTGKKFVVNSDTHSTDSIVFMLDETASELAKKGYEYITSLDEIL